MMILKKGRSNYFVGRMSSSYGIVSRALHLVVKVIRLLPPTGGRIREPEKPANCKGMSHITTAD